MLSRIVPANSQVSCSTIPICARSAARGIDGDVDAVEGDPAAVELVEPHHQVDQRGLAGAGRADDRDRLARVRDQREVRRSAGGRRS